MLIRRGPSKKHRFSTKHDLRRARSRPHPSSDLCENLMDQISLVYIFCQESFKSVTVSAFELLSNHSMTHAQNPKRSGQIFYQYNALWAMNERAQEVSQSKLHVSCRLKVNSRNSTISHLEASYSSQDPKKEVECASAHVH